MLILTFFTGLLITLWYPYFFVYFLGITLVIIVFTIYLKNKKILLLLFALIAGCVWGEVHFYFHLKQMLPETIENKKILVEGRIASVPANFEHYSQFQFQIEKIYSHQWSPWQGKVILSWYSNRYMRISKMSTKFVPGQKWRLMIKLKKPRGYNNPGSFDYEAWLFEQNIQAKGYITGMKPIFLEPSGYHYWIEQIRQHMAQIWQPYTKTWPFLGVLLAFTVGLTSGITPEQWQVFTYTGTIHLISISGFHISLMAGLAYACINFIWRRIYFLCEYWPAQKAAAVSAIMVGLIYSLLAGFSIPTQRSLVMLSVFMGGILVQRQTNMWQCFRLSLLAVILLDPFAPLTISFWLSFSAVAIIVYAVMDSPISTKKHKILQSAWQGLKLQTHIFLGLIPFGLFWFSQVSVSSLWANLIAIPVTGFFILPLALAAIICSSIYWPMAVFLMKISHWFFSLLFWYLHGISEKHPILLLATLDKIWMLLLGTVGILLLLAPKGWPKRWLGLIFWLPLLFPPKTNIPYGEAYFSLLDVGQGLASVVQTKNHTLVFDTGPKLSENFDTGKAVVLPYLRNQHISQLDTLIISHADMDHRGGLASVLRGIKVDHVFVNDLKILQQANLCEPNISWKWDGVKFQFLTKGLKKLTDTNDTSCVLKIANTYHSILLPGDLEKRGEKVLIKNYGSHLKADLIVAGHHGSKTSSSPEWVKIIQPHYVLWATGYLNRYHFPNTDVVTRYQDIGTETLSTADCGMIHWILSNQNKMESPMCYRKEILNRF